MAFSISMVAVEVAAVVAVAAAAAAAVAAAVCAGGRWMVEGFGVAMVGVERDDEGGSGGMDGKCEMLTLLFPIVVV
jgi:hypothetical protein